ncbi:MAG: anhydro-N-acetylmuramic acid kinase [Pseudomonadota bacterium]
MVEVSTGQPVWALGFMTGTSMDGVDAAAILTDGETVEMFGPTLSIPFSGEDSDALRQAIEWCAEHWPNHGKLRRKVDLWDIEILRQADERLVNAHVRATISLTEQLNQHPSQMSPPWVQCFWGKRGQVDVLGFHGQTVLHRPETRFTLQIGDAVLLAERSWLKAPIVHDFRSEDVAQDGQGAPLAPFYHFALAKHIGATEPLAFLNIGGVGNVTWVDPSKDAPEEPGALIAFDTGPGNALVNDWMQAQTGDLLDRDGTAAAQGRVHRDRLSTNSGQAYLDRRPPKSLDRNDFHGVLTAMAGLSTEDGAATLTAFTADAVAQSLKHMPSPPSRWLICGGGRHNKTMMQMLADRLNAPVDPVETVGLDGDMLEAQAFAYLAVRVLRGLPTSAPSTTGCREPVCGGRILYPA